MATHQISTLSDLATAMAEAQESEHIEFKEAKQSFSTDELLKYCVAFANEGGGQIVFGVTDKPPRRIVGTNAFENINKVKKRVFDALDFRVEVSELEPCDGRVVIVTVPSRAVGVPVQLDGKFWMRVGESLVPMTADRLRHIFSEVSESGVGSRTAFRSVGYLCGKRLARVRGDLGLQPSHFVDLVDYPGESLWRAAETDQVEVTEASLLSVAELAGVNLDWLKHGVGCPYPVREVYDLQWENELRELEGVDSYSLRMAIEPRSMRCFLLHQHSEYRSTAYAFQFTLDFWRWADDRHHIPRIWQLLTFIRQHLRTTQSGILEKRDADSLEQGQVHARLLLEGRWKRSDWFDDLFDLRLEHKHLRAAYDGYGEWFGRLQQSFVAWGEAETGES